MKKVLSVYESNDAFNPGLNWHAKLPQKKQNPAGGLAADPTARKPQAQHKLQLHRFIQRKTGQRRRFATLFCNSQQVKAPKAGKG